MARDALRIHRRPTLAIACALAGAATFVGCGGTSAQSTSNGDAEFASTRPVETAEVRTTSGNVPGVLQPMNRPIVQGPLPLFYLVESPMTLRITNVDTGEEITVVEVKPPQIVRVERRGVMLGNEVALGATLAPGTYAMTPLSDNAGVIRAQQTISRQTLPTSQPADTPPPAAE